MNKWPVTSLVFALATALSAFGVVAVGPGAADSPTQDRPVAVKVVTAYTSVEAPSFPGRVEAGDSAQLAFRISGQLRELRVKMGERVQQGALLAELDPTDYQLNLDARQAEFDLARLEADRASALHEQRLISEDQFDTAQTVLATSAARLEQAREQLSFCRLTAPFAGAIAFTYAMPSEIVAPHQPILNLQDLSTLEVRFTLPSRFQPLLQGRDPAVFTVTFELLPGVPLPARVKELGMRPDPDTNSYPVTLLVDSPANLSARPGMPVSVHLHHPSLLESLWEVPREALFERSTEGARVWRIDPATMTIHGVRIELDAGGVLRAGLNPGDLIVAAGVDGLREGQQVRPWVREGGL